jgi:hypothetical protein
MKKTIYILSGFAIFMILVVSACGGAPATPVAPVATAALPTQAPTVEVQAPTVEVQAPTPEPPPTTQAFAPACQASSSCTAPDVPVDKPVEQTICLAKIPWQNYLVSEGTVFEYVPKEGDPEPYPLICKVTGAKQGDKIYIGCHGKQLWTYNAKVTNPSCASSALQEGTTSCADGQGYDAANNCCSPLATGDAGSVIIKVNIGACP